MNPDIAPTLRVFLDELASAGELREITARLDVRHEISAALSLLDPGLGGTGPAVRMTNVADSRMPVVGNIYGSRRRIARSLGLAGNDLHESFLAALGARHDPRPNSDAPWQAVQVPDPDLTAELPVPWFFEHETGPYLTAGVIVAREPATGRGNLSIARLKPLRGARAMVGIAPNHHLAAFARQAQERGEPLELAVCLGVEPAVLLAACLYLAQGDDEMAYAGGLARRPIDVVELSAGGPKVPVESEIVLVGTLEPSELVEEGPVSEFHGMYERYGSGPVFTATRLLRREDAFLQVVEPGLHTEHVLLGAVAIEAGLTRQLRRRIPAVRAIRVTDEGAGRLAARVALGPHRRGLARQVMHAIWGEVSLIKNIVVLDEDVPLDDAAEVDRAIQLRVRPDRDLMVVPYSAADRAEPLEREGLGTRLGIDATRWPDDRDWTPAAPPRAALDRVAGLIGFDRRPRLPVADQKPPE
ncbi:UbiD family decarboxylase [Pseudonocardia spinosispora]|uniref:UbiD family decarboxylase n=1 Tax=Pseudonocardia spinosispora TaxID=103441 RepID=UPI00041931E0|nr:UbiD family decarboxylase [Pseudonocardia spinosispora]